MIINQKKKYEITYSQLLDNMLFLSFTMSVIAAHTILDNLAMFIFITMVFLLRFKNFKKTITIYFILEIVFILYSYWQIKSGIALNQIVAMEKVNTLFISLVYYISIYMYILGTENREKVIEILVKSILLALTIILLCDYKNIFNGRFGTNVNAGINILGITIGRLNSTYIGQLSGIALYLSLIIYWKKNKKKAIVYALFFIFMILISGTRKVLIIILVAYITIPYLYDKRKNFIKLMSRAILVCILALITYKLVMDIPFFYNSVGVRIESVIEVLIKGQTDEASFNTRERLIKIGMSAFEQKPINGWGLDNFKYVINNGGYYAHNNFVEILVSGGKVGFIIYYLKYFYIILTTFTCRKRKMKEDYNDIKALRILLITLIVLEYWQVTYYYRLFLLPFIITLAFINKDIKLKDI